MSNVLPITPEQVKKALEVPDTVIAAVNKLLTIPDYKILCRDEILSACESMHGIDAVYNIHLLTIAEVYRQAGWDVTYLQADHWGGAPDRLIFKEPA